MYATAMPLIENKWYYNSHGSHFTKRKLTETMPWINNDMHCDVWDGLSHPCRDCNGSEMKHHRGYVWMSIFSKLICL